MYFYSSLVISRNVSVWTPDLNISVRKKNGHFSTGHGPMLVFSLSLWSPFPPLCLLEVSQEWQWYNSTEDRNTSFFTSLSFLFFLFLIHFLLWGSTDSPQVGSEGPESCQHFSSSKRFVQKAGCYPEGCDRWQGHRAELGWLTQVERHQGAGSRALEIIPGLLQLLILTVPHPSNLWILEVGEPRCMLFFFFPLKEHICLSFPEPPFHWEY